MDKRCYKCNETKTITQFVRRTGVKSNYRNICKACENLRVKSFNSTPEARKKSTENMRKWRSIPGNREKASKNQLARNRLSPKVAFRLMIFNARKRAEVNVTISELESLWEHQKRKCALTGIIMTWGQGKIMPASMSLDRINPDLPYFIGNLRLVYHAINCFRGRMSDTEMLAMAKTLVNHMDPEKMHWIESNSDDDRAWIH